MTVAVKWHVNGEKKPGKCSAKKGQCPFGAETPHYGTKREAEAAAEELIARESAGFSGAFSGNSEVDGAHLEELAGRKAKVYCMYGSSSAGGATEPSSIGVVSDGASIEHVGAGGRVDRLAGGRIVGVEGGRVGTVLDGGRINHVFNNGRVVEVSSDGVVFEVDGAGATVGIVGGDNARGKSGGLVRVVANGGRVEFVTGHGTVSAVAEGGVVGEVSKAGCVERVKSGGRVGRVTGRGAAVDVVMDGGVVGEVSGDGCVQVVKSGGRVGVVAGDAAVGENDGVIGFVGSPTRGSGGVSGPSLTWNHEGGLVECVRTDGIVYDNEGTVNSVSSGGVVERLRDSGVVRSLSGRVGRVDGTRSRVENMRGSAGEWAEIDTIGRSASTRFRVVERSRPVVGFVGPYSRVSFETDDAAEALACIGRVDRGALEAGLADIRYGGRKGESLLPLLMEREGVSVGE